MAGMLGLTRGESSKTWLVFSYRFSLGSPLLSVGVASGRHVPEA